MKPIKTMLDGFFIREKRLKVPVLKNKEFVHLNSNFCEIFRKFGRYFKEEFTLDIN